MWNILLRFRRKILFRAGHQCAGERQTELVKKSRSFRSRSFYYRHNRLIFCSSGVKQVPLKGTCAPCPSSRLYFLTISCNLIAQDFAIEMKGKIGGISGMKIIARVLVLFGAFGVGTQSFNLPAPPTPVPGFNLPAPPTPVPGVQMQ